MLPKIIVILGPTAAGKTALSLKLAKECNGEIISADSRQIYKKMSIGTDKPMGVHSSEPIVHRANRRDAYMVEGVPHYCMDIVDPGKELSLADFKKIAIEHIRDIIARGKVPFVAGGTGLYIWSLVDNLTIPAVAPNKNSRRSLEEKTLPEPAVILKKVDPES